MTPPDSPSLPSRVADARPKTDNAMLYGALSSSKGLPRRGMSWDEELGQKPLDVAKAEGIRFVHASLTPGRWVIRRR
jgi:hypothetical protein